MSDPPPCLLKKSAREALPATFMERSWVKVQLSRLVELKGIWIRSSKTRHRETAHRTKEICTPRLRCTEEQSRQR